MAEMLLQSHLNEIHLLPAKPDAWKEGEVSGLKARGNYEVDIKWKNNLITNATIKSNNGGLCTLRTQIPVKVKGFVLNSTKTANGFVVSFNTIKGKTYFITAL